jgi:hypothetical protein
MIRLRAGEFQSLMLEFQGCSILDEALLRGYLLADLPAELRQPVEMHIRNCHCCNVAIQILSSAVTATSPTLPEDLRARIFGELADHLADRKLRLRLPGGFTLRRRRRRGTGG